MKKVLIVLGFIVVFVINGVSQNVEFSYPLPDFVKNNKFLYTNSPFFEQINIVVSKDNRKAIIMNGLVTPSYAKYNYYQKKLIEFGDIKPERKMKSIKVGKILFLDEANNIIKEITMPYHLSIKLIDYHSNPVAVIRTSIHHGNWNEAKDIYFYTLDGHLIKKVSPSNESNIDIIPSKDGNYFAFAHVDIDYIGQFEIFEVGNALFNSLKNKNIQSKYTLKFEGRKPDHFLFLGGDDIELIIATGATLKNLAVKTKETLWKIDNIGKNISFLNLNKNKQLVVKAYPLYFLIDPETGEIQTQFNIKKIPFIYNFLRKNKTDTGSIYLEKGNLHITTFYRRYEFVIKNINSSDKQKTIELYSRKQTLKLPEKKVIREKNNRIYYLFIENGELKMLSQSKNNAYIKKKITETTIPSTQLSIE